MNLGSQLVNKQSVMPGSSCASWKPAVVGDGGVPDQFPAGLRVLVVDDDPTCLMILEKMLRNCNYEATKCNRAEVALSYLRENKNGFDIVLSDVHMPDMDGFKLLEHIGLEMDLPVIMMSADDSKSVVMKGVTHGACDYLIKPVRIEALRNIWQHVVRKRKHEWKDFEPSASADQQKPAEDADYSSSANEGSNWKSSKKRKDEDDEGEERDDSSSSKKPRVVWSVELHQQFVAAVNQLGIDKAVPKKILELMNVPGLTRENVASHLQKYRLYLRRLSGSQHSGGMNTSFMGNTDSGYGSISSLSGLDFQALAASGQLGQLPAHSLATLQAAALGRSNNGKSHTSLPIMDQRNIFSFENPKPRYGEVQTQPLGGKQMNLLHGIPTNMEPKQLVGLQQSGQHSFSGQVLIPMGGQGQAQAQAQTQTQNPSSSNHHHIPRQHISSNGMLGGQSQSQSQGSSISNNHHQVPRQPVLAGGMLPSSGVADTTTAVYGTPASPVVDFSMNHKTDVNGNRFPLGGGLGIPVQGGGNIEGKVSRGGVVPSYGIFNDLNQGRAHEWGAQNIGLNFDSSQLTNNMQGTGWQNRSSGGTHSHRSAANVGQQRNANVGHNPLNVKAESLGLNDVLYSSEQYDQDDLLTMILKQQQQQEGFGQVENEFGFDLPV